jgi:hypothetical protein
MPMTVSGGILVAALALVVEILLAGLQRRLAPGPRRRRVLPGIDATIAPPPA